MEFRLRTYEGGLLSGPSTTVLQRLQPLKSYQLQQLVDLLLSENLREHVARIHIGPLISNFQRSMALQPICFYFTISTAVGAYGNILVLSSAVGEFLYRNPPKNLPEALEFSVGRVGS